ncbi:MAG: cytochrome c [Bacteroidia bacterium]|nr:cytochrome c [Bacteroidia bacterium]
MKKILSRSAILLIVFTICLVYNSFAQVWIVPDNKKKKTSSFKFSQVSVSDGEAIYLKTCQSCHGIPGKENFAKLNPSPGDLSTDKVQKQLDGELFFKITMGRGLMPSFKNVLKEEERWKLISYLRSFNDAYAQPPLSAPSSGCKGCVTNIELMYLQDSSRMLLKAIGTLNGNNIPISDAEVSLFVKRYFGDMQIGKTVNTDSAGPNTFNLPKNIRGDQTGNVIFIIRITDEKQFGETQDTIEMQIGIPTNNPPLNENRALWNVVSKAPLWLTISYSTVVLIVIGCILYVIFQLLRLKRKSKTRNSK